MGNLGTSDKASNYFLEKRNLMKALSKENNTIRDLLEEEIVDGLDYIRIKEQIAEARSWGKELLEFKFSSDEEEN